MDRSPAIDLTLFEKWGDVRLKMQISLDKGPDPVIM